MDFLFLNRETERNLKILINKHLFENDIMFHVFFHISREQFGFSLLLLKLDIYKIFFPYRIFDYNVFVLHTCTVIQH